jgi:uncharacterized protein (TIRG00374 family)
MKKTIIGVIISLVLALWLVWGLKLELVWASFDKVIWPYIFLYISFLLVLQYLRSLRWQLLLRPLLSVGQKALFPITSVGTLALLILPARGGEFARPYLLSKKAPISMSAALATIVVERILDVLTILIFVMIASFSETLPQWINWAGYIAMVIMGAILSILFLLIFNEQATSRIAERILKPFPHRMVELFRNFISSFSKGARILIHGRVMAGALLFSVLLWSGVALLNYIMFLAFAFPLSMTAAYILVIIVDLGLMIPSAPGFVGSFQFLCVVSLALFGIGREEALSFSILSHLLQTLFVVGLGLGFLPMMKLPGFSFRKGKSYSESPVAKN